MIIAQQLWLTKNACISGNLILKLLFVHEIKLIGLYFFGLLLPTLRSDGRLSHSHQAKLSLNTPHIVQIQITLRARV